MSQINNFKNLSVKESYDLMNMMIESQLEIEKDFIANLSNISSIINQAVSSINWVGFYFLKKDELVLGPFQGLTACNRININEGVCGACVRSNETLVINNVHEFSGHIACDSATNSEMVIPVHKNDKIIAVLDIDSQLFSRFSENDKINLEKSVKIIEKFILL